MYLVSRTDTFAKLFFLVSISGLLMYIILAFYTFHTAYTSIYKMQKYQEQIKSLPDPDLSSYPRFENDFKYILWWTIDKGNHKEKHKFRSTIPIEDTNPLGDGQNLFIDHNCSYVNCYLTTNKDLLNGDYRNFDALILKVDFLLKWKKEELPEKRSQRQKYIFYGMQSSDEIPICNPQADNYFNWTWSYKLYSDIFHPFFEVKDSIGNVVAPNVNVEWPLNMSYLSVVEVQNKKPKKKALAWIINRCNKKAGRLKYAKALQKEMKSQDLVFDIFGCGQLKCPEEGCLKAIERDYYFYFAFEDGFADDYLTDEVLNAYNHNAVPIVMSGADLTKFLPETSYIDAAYSSPEKIASTIDYIIKNPLVYYGFHRWRNHFSFHKVDRHRGICELCSFLNNVDMINTSRHYRVFRKWWYPSRLKERCSMIVSDLRSNFNKSRIL